MEMLISEKTCNSPPAFCRHSFYSQITFSCCMLSDVGQLFNRNFPLAGQRQVEHSAILLAVYKENPNAQWVLRCHHRNANNASAAS